MRSRAPKKKQGEHLAVVLVGEKQQETNISLEVVNTVQCVSFLWVDPGWVPCTLQRPCLSPPSQLDRGEKI